MTSRNGSQPQWSTGSPGSGSISDDYAVIRALNLGLTIFLFVVFMAPIIVAVQIAADFDAAFWIGRIGYLAALLPLIFFILHFLHLHEVRRQRRNPKFVWFIFAIVFPAILLLIIGGYYMMSANWLYGQLKSDDCSGQGYVPEKRGLQLAYNDASRIYDQCVTRLYIANNNKTLERRPVLQNCRDSMFGSLRAGQVDRNTQRRVGDSKQAPIEPFPSSCRCSVQGWFPDSWLDANDITCSRLCARFPPHRCSVPGGP